ncbi:MAG TPA: sugar ABC transporter permease, partial [Anaerolineales bacterium]|nr:sugar ABC transporter permease [Anaerolineales bacterium]
QARYFRRLLIPSLVILSLITILPVLYLIVTSFTSWDLSRPGSLQFIGLRNYIRIISEDKRFWNSVIVQVKLTLMTVPAQIIIGLGLAIFVREKIKNPVLVELARGTFLIPMVIPPIVAALIWKILFTPPVSILSYISVELGFGQLAWLGDAKLALVAIAIASIWEFFPFCFLLLYAALLSLPEEPIEAAKVDGASGWQIFRYVNLPMLWPTMSIVLLFRIVDSIRSFPMIYVMTQGGPGFVTEPTNFYAYQQGFSYSYVGYSSAIIVVMFGFTMALTALLLRSIRWDREEE